MKFNHLNIFFTALTLTLMSCENNPDAKKAEESIENATEKVGEAVDNTVEKVKEKIDENFISNTLDDNAEEMEWLRAGTMMGTDSELKNIARQMIPDHEKIASDLKAYAASNDFKVDKISDGVSIDSKTGTTWDAEWTTKILKMHHNLIDKFERTQGNTKDQALKELVTTNLPVLRNHLNMIEKLDARLNK